MMRTRRMILIGAFLFFTAALVLQQAPVLADACEGCGDLYEDGGCSFTINWPGCNYCPSVTQCTQGSCAIVPCGGGGVDEVGQCYYNEWSSWIWFRCVAGG
jgi:hypothetical protein